MATLQIRKKSTHVWQHIPSDISAFIISKFYAKTDGNIFKIVEDSGSNRREYLYSDITVYDDTDAGLPETFASSEDLMLRLEELIYQGFNGGGITPTFDPSGYDLEDFTNEGADPYVHQSEINEHYRGTYTSEANLNIAIPTGNLGDYAIVDVGVGNDAVQYNWDASEGWIESGSSGAATTDALPEGTSNLYFTNQRAKDAVISQTVTNGVTTTSPSEDAVFDFVTSTSAPDRTFYINSTTGNDATGRIGNINFPFQTTAGAFAKFDANLNVAYTLVYINNAYHVMPLIPIRDIHFKCNLNEAYLDFTSTAQNGISNVLDSVDGEGSTYNTFKFTNIVIYSNSATSKRFVCYRSVFEFDRCRIDWLTISNILFIGRDIKGNFLEIKTRSTTSQFFNNDGYTDSPARSIINIKSLNLLSGAETILFKNPKELIVHIESIVGTGSVVLFTGGFNCELHLYSITTTSGSVYIGDQIYDLSNKFIFHNTILGNSSILDILGCSGIYTGNLKSSNTSGLSATSERQISMFRFENFIVRLNNFSKTTGDSVYEFKDCYLTSSTTTIKLIGTANPQVSNNLRFIGVNTIKQDTPSAIIDNLANFTGTIEKSGIIYTNATAIDNDGTITINDTTPNIY